MRILYIHQHFATTDSFGGVRSFIFSKHLVSKGHEVIVITSNKFLPEKYKSMKRFEVDGIKVKNINTNYTDKLNFMQRISAFIKFMIISTYFVLRSSPDIVFATSTPLTVAFPGIVAKLFKRVPFIFELRDLWPDVPIELGIIKNRILILLLKVFEQTAYRFADRIVCISEGIRDKVPAPSSKKVYIPIGCDFNLFNSKKDTRWKREIGLSDRTLFVFTGSIGIANCPEYLMEAARLLKERNNKDICLALIGDGSAKQKILKIKDEYQLDNVLIFDPVPKIKLHEILAAADGGIILHGLSATYRETASPNKFYDYVAAGLPVIFNFQGSLKDLIINKKAGYYVDHRYPEQLSETLLHIARNKSEALEFGKNARCLAEDRFDQKKLAIQFERVFLNLHE